MELLTNHVAGIWTTFNNENRKRSWGRLFIWSILLVYFYVLMEWLFFVTKPSFMDVMDFRQKFEILLVTGLFLSLLVLAILLLLYGLSLVPGLSRGWKLFLLAGALFPAAFLTVTTLLLIDNFSYTLVKFGIVSAQGTVRIIYAAAFIVIFGIWLNWLINRLAARTSLPQKERSLTAQSVFCVGIVLLSSIFALPKLTSLNFVKEDSSQRLTDRPNILLIGSDGMNAENMSVYGYERDTTPIIRHLAETGLVAENAFTNSGNTSGSIISIMNGKLPTKTRVIYPPDILRGADAFQHLPGILRSEGYYTVEISVPHYIDPYTLNMQNSFDVVNGETVDQAGFHAFTQLPAFQDTGYFLSILAERVSDRLLHIFYIKSMTNVYQEVTGNNIPQITDRERVNQLLYFLNKHKDQPLFAHVHLMGTHGAKFYPAQRVFSAGIKQDQNWMPEFYDDAILEFDAYVGEIVDELSESGQLDNTILIIYTDHVQKYETNRRLPLIFFFPAGEFSGRIRNNTQNLDIAPTLLDYLGLTIPDWMEGQSLLQGEPDPNRLIYSTAVAYIVETEDEGLWAIDSERMVPPFYQFGYLQAIVCDRVYRQELRQLKWIAGVIPNHTSPCGDQSSSSEAMIHNQIIERLQEDGFDISVLQEK